MKKILKYTALIIGVPIGLVLCVFWVQLWLLYNTNPPKLVVSKETTHITEPLDEDGYVDYVAAYNLRFGKGVTPKNNVFVEVLRAIGPTEDMNEEDVSRLCKALGIEPLPMTGNDFSNEGEFFQEQFPDDMHAQLNAPDAWRETLTSPLRRPWKEEDYPHLAEWLKRNDASLDRLVIASQGDRYFCPVVRLNGESLLSSQLKYDFIDDFSSMGTLLAARSMQRLGQGDIEGAWEDIYASVNLARLFSTTHNVVNCLAAYHMQASANEPLVTLLADSRVTSEQRHQWLEKYLGAAKFALLSDCYNTTDRWSMLDHITWTFSLCTALEEAGSEEKLTYRVDLNLLLPRINDSYDSCVAGARYREAGSLPEIIESEEEGAEEEEFPYMDHPWRIYRDILIGKGHEAHSNVFFEMVAAISMPSVGMTFHKDSQRKMELQMLPVVVALCDYRDKKGEHPESLDNLVPGYIDEIPKDTLDLDGGLVRYIKTADGFRVHSVGSFGHNELGVVEGELDAAVIDSYDITAFGDTILIHGEAKLDLPMKKKEYVYPE